MILVKNIKKLVQIEDMPKTWVAGSDMKVLPSIDDAYLYIYDGLFADFGPMSSCPDHPDAEVVDAGPFLIEHVLVRGLLGRQVRQSLLVLGDLGLDASDLWFEFVEPVLDVGQAAEQSQAAHRKALRT